MSADIFISYRHGKTDSWVAGRLNDTLGHEFSVFFDTRRQANDYGDDFTQQIDEALATCRVMFVVIGPDWVAGISRLAEARDWVSHEVSAALLRRNVRIVPLFASLEKVPDLENLPLAINGLRNKTGELLNTDQWEIEASDLINRLKNWLRVEGSGSQGTQSEWNDAFAYLCNRTAQEETLVDWFVKVKTAALSGPVTCVLHGYKEEAHQEFVERLESGKKLLEEVLDAQDVGVVVQALQVNSEKLRNRQYVPAFMSGIKGSVLNRRTAPDDEVRTHLRALSQPLLLVLQLTWFDYQAIGSDLAGLIDAWQTLLKTSDGVQPSRLPYPVVLWINLTYEDVGDHAPNAPGDTLLSELRTVKQSDIRTWASGARVRVLLGDKRDRVIDLATDQRYYVVPGELHMRRFADGVRDVISAP